jgi:hypothetical protein
MIDRSWNDRPEWVASLIVFAIFAAIYSIGLTTVEKCYGL